jgi:hypothetical protein
MALFAYNVTSKSGRIHPFLFVLKPINITPPLPFKKPTICYFNFCYKTAYFTILPKKATGCEKDGKDKS